MHDRDVGSGDCPPSLLDDYLAVARDAEPGTLAAMAVRTGAVPARLLLARAAAGRCATLDEILDAARGGDRAWVAARRRRMDPSALADLAWVVALQDPAEQGVALALYDLILDGFGPARMPPAHQGMHAQLAYACGQRERVAALLCAYPDLPEDVRPDLVLDLANPFTGDVGRGAHGSGADSRAERRWWRGFEALLPESGVVLSPDERLAPFDRLTSGDQAPPHPGPTVTVVVTCFRPGTGLITAMRSLVAQSWVDTEILLVDDGSPSGYGPLLDRCARLDRRITLLRLPANGGTYRARNAGLDAATGRFVTFHDCDDWSHPRRLERQVGPLLAGPMPIATTSDGILVSDGLTLTQPGRTRRAR